MRGEPLTGGAEKTSEPHKPVHETTTDSCTGNDGNEGETFATFLAGKVTDSVIETHRERGSP